MGILSENICIAVDTIINSKISKLKFDTSIEAIIVGVSGSSDSLVYIINYNGQNFMATAANREIKYEINDKVQVIIPNGDWTANKIIIGLSAHEWTAVDNNYAKLNWIYSSPNLILDNKKIYEITQSEDKKDMPQYVDKVRTLENYRKGKNLLRLSANFQTNFQSIHTEGNYGVQIILKKINKEIKKENNSKFQNELSSLKAEDFKNEQEYQNALKELKELYIIEQEKLYQDEVLKLDISQFSGNPYGFSVPIEQSTIYQLDSNCEYSISNINFLFNGFSKDQIYENAELIDNPNTLIYISDLYLAFVDNNPIEDGKYNIQFYTPEGLTFNPSLSIDEEGNIENITDLISINPYLYFGVTELDLEKTSNWRWFIENNQSLSSEIGEGWEPLELDNKNFNIKAMNKNNGFLKLGFPLSDYELNIQKNSNWEKINLKVVTTYTGETEKVDIISETLTISKDDVLEYTTFYNWGSHDFTITVKGKNNISLYGEQYRAELRMGEYIIHSEEMPTNQMDSFPIILHKANYYFSLYENSNLYLDIYNLDQTNSLLITTFFIPFPIKPEKEDGNEIANIIGEDIFKYEANGLLYPSLLTTDYTLQVIPVGEDKKITDIQWNYQLNNKWISIPSSTETKGLEYSLLKDLKVIDNVLHFSLKDSFDITKIENNFLVSFNIDGIVYKLNKKITYIKDGDNGTNGTGYYCTVEFQEEKKEENDNSQFSKVLYVYLDDKNEKVANKFIYKIKCFKDGQQVNINKIDTPIKTNYYSTEINSRESTIEVCLNPSALGNNSLTDDQYFIKLSIQPEDSNLFIFYYLAPPYAFGAVQEQAIFNDDLKKINTNFINLPRTIMYNTNGYSPNWNSSTAIKVLTSNIESVSAGGISDKEPKLLTTIVDESTSQPLLYLKPIDSITHIKNGIYKIKQTFSSGSNTTKLITIYYPIIFYINTYGNEQINGWDGQTLQVDKWGNYILSPTLGAGIKHEDNSFTGVVMGVDGAQEKVGLYGYKKGIRTFSFDENGDAYLAGKIDANEGSFQGKVVAKEGSIGGWNIESRNYGAQSYTELGYEIPNFKMKSSLTNATARIFLRPSTVDANENNSAIFGGTVKNNQGQYEGKIFAIRPNGQAEFRSIEIFGGPSLENGNYDYTDNRPYGYINVYQSDEGQGINSLEIGAYNLNGSQSKDCFISLSSAQNFAEPNIYLVVGDAGLTLDRNSLIILEEIIQDRKNK